MVISMSTKIRKIGRDARNGQYIPVKEAQARKSTAIVETIKTPKK
jgi:hypothetical protein